MNINSVFDFFAAQNPQVLDPSELCGDYGYFVWVDGAFTCVCIPAFEGDPLNGDPCEPTGMGEWSSLKNQSCHDAMISWRHYCMEILSLLLTLCNKGNSIGFPL